MNLLTAGGLVRILPKRRIIYRETGQTITGAFFGAGADVINLMSYKSR